MNFANVVFLILVPIVSLALSISFYYDFFSGRNWYYVNRPWVFFGRGVLTVVAAWIFVPLVCYIVHGFDAPDNDVIAAAPIIGIMLHVAYILWMKDIEKENLTREQEAWDKEQEARKKKQEAREKAREKKCWEYARNTLAALPYGARLFFDTCVLMSCEADFMRVWFESFMGNVKSRNWRVVIIQPVMDELDHSKTSAARGKSRRSRAATNFMLREFDAKLNNAHYSVIGDSLKVGEKADDKFRCYMRPEDILITMDVNLYLTAKRRWNLKALLLHDPDKEDT